MNWFTVELQGQLFPNNNTYDLLESSDLRAYEIYLNECEKESMKHPLCYLDWKYRYNSFTFSYDSADRLFPELYDQMLSGIPSNLAHIRANIEFSDSNLSPSFFLYNFHYVPAMLIFSKEGTVQMVK